MCFAFASYENDDFYHFFIGNSIHESLDKYDIYVYVKMS